MCNTILDVHWCILLKVLFNSGLTVTFISQKCLPRGPRLTELVASTLWPGMASEMVILQAIQLPELDKNQVIKQHMALVLNGKVRYYLILGNDFLMKSDINNKYSSRTIEWFDSKLTIQIKNIWITIGTPQGRTNLWQGPVRSRLLCHWNLGYQV